MTKKDTSVLLGEIKGRLKKAAKAGCLPSDNCCFDLATNKCMFCSRIGGTPVDTYDKKFQAVTDSLDDVARLTKALEIAMKALDELHDKVAEVAEKSVGIFQIAAIHVCDYHGPNFGLELQRAFDAKAEIDRILDVDND